MKSVKYTMQIAKFGVKIILIVVIISPLLWFIYSKSQPNSENTPTENKNMTVKYGSYNPNGTNERLDISHYYIAWNKNEEINLSNSKMIMLSIEPWYDDELGSANLFNDITEGKYDQYIIGFCTELNSYDNEFWIRWGHEMDSNQGRYPWSKNDPDGYKSAYKYFVNECKKYTDKAKYVWSPAGEPELYQFWPGDEYVDLIGLSVYNNIEWNKENLGSDFSFKEILDPKYAIASKLGKPVIVTEVGTTGPVEYKKTWISKMVEDARKFKDLRAIVYFNAQDNHGVWDTESTPDWRIDESWIIEANTN